MATIAAALAVTPTAGAARGLFVGASEDNIKWRTSEALAVARDLGLKAFRVTVAWHPGMSSVGKETAAELDSALATSFGLRVVVAVYGKADEAPRDAAARDEFCSFTKSLLMRYPLANDVVIWNEPNLSYFWRPQFDDDRSSAAPAAYEALLARCWDVLHAYRPAVNVITNTSPRGNDRWWAPSNISHSPGNFIRKMGEAYRLSRRQRPAFDTVGHHAYGHSGERPWKRHEAGMHYAQGDLDQLVESLRTGFGGTGQPVPGQCVDGRCAAIWSLEAGYQTEPDAAKRSLYRELENDDHVLPDVGAGERDDATPDEDSLAPDHATQLVDGLRLAYCQPYVAAFFNFLLWDEADLGRWQSGVLWADGEKKGSYAAMQRVVGEINGETVDCSKLKGGRGGGAARSAPPAVPAPTATAAPASDSQTAAEEPEQESAVAARTVSRGIVRSLEWPAAAQFRRDNLLWRFRVEVSARATFRAGIYRAGSRKAAVVTAGSLTPRRLEYVRFPEQRLRVGTYRLAVTVTTPAKPRQSVKLTSPPFVVR
jgi:hypothetical protein